MDYDLIVVKTLERVYKNYYYIIRGENRIRVEVIANMAYKERDEFSKYFPLPPSGILGPVELWEITNS